MKYFSILTLIFLLSLICAPQKSGDVLMTVTGPMAASDIGFTLPHEHLLVDFIGADSTGSFRWDREKVAQKVTPYLLEIKELGINTFIDCTPAFLGRDPLLLKMLSEKSGLNILTTTGYYGAYNNKFIPQSVLEKSAEELAEIWIGEYRDGIDGASVRPGIIKIAVERDTPLSEKHKKLVKAAALTHLSTGLTIVSHTGPESAAYEQVALLEEYGVSPTAFVWTHANEGKESAHIDLAKRGVWISLDKIDEEAETIAKMVDLLKNLKENKLLDKVLISHDAGWYKPEQEGGGVFRGFTSIFTHLLPALKENGFDEADIRQMMVENPREAYTIRVRKSDL